MQNIYHTAYFIDNPQDLLSMFKTDLPVIYAHHSTNKYKPDNLDGVEIGKKVKLKIIGRAKDDKCDVLLVENDKSENKYPHITLSCTKVVPPMYSNQLLEMTDKDGSIEYFSDAKYINVTEGYVIKEERAVVG
jgi:hypothetical protein